MKKRYDSYKPSGIDWIGDIPSHWTVSKLKHHIHIDSGDYISKDEISDDNKIPVFGGGEQIGLASKSNVSENTLIIGRVGARCGCVTPIIQRAWATDNSLICIPKKDFKFLYYLLLAANLNKLNESNAQPLITSTKVKNLIIGMPPLAEQEAIAAWLDTQCEEIDAAITKVDREIELIDELKQSEISRVVTRGLNPDTPLRPSGIDWIGDIPEHWEIASFKRSIRINNGCDYKHVVADEGYPVIGSGGQFAYATGYLYDGEVLLLGRKGTIDRPMYFVGKFWTVDTMFYAVPNKDICCKYMYYQALGFPFDYYSTSTALPSMAANDLANNPIAVPPLSEQQAIADYLDKKCAVIDGLKAKLTKKRETLKELRQSIISEVVTGKRKVI